MGGPLDASRPILAGDDEDDRRAALARLVLANPVVAAILPRARALSLPGWYLTAGCLFRSAWNGLTGREPTHRIRDHGLFCFDGSDLSWEAEDRVIRRCAAAFADLGAEVEVRNEARVHLRCEGRFGVACAPFASTEAAIDAFAATACAVAVRLGPTGEFTGYAPFGFGDLFGLVVRPNAVLAPAAVYRAKAQRWKAAWPELTVLPWPGAAPTGPTAG